MTGLPHVSFDDAVELISFTWANTQKDVCYKPATAVSDEAKKTRLEAYASRTNITHDPAKFRVKERLPPSDHASYDFAIRRPLQNPVLSKRAKQLIGLEPY